MFLNRVQTKKKREKHVQYKGDVKWNKQHEMTLVGILAADFGWFKEQNYYEERILLTQY